MILAESESGRWEWVSSEVIDLDVSKTPDPERRRRVVLLASYTDRSIAVGEPEIERAKQFEAGGLSAFDALHLASAERSGEDVFPTTDDALLRKSTACIERLRVRVENPLVWLREVG